jgi:hypothetical protein
MSKVTRQDQAPLYEYKGEEDSIQVKNTLIKICHISPRKDYIGRRRGLYVLQNMLYMAKSKQQMTENYQCVRREDLFQERKTKKY